MSTSSYEIPEANGTVRLRGTIGPQRDLVQLEDGRLLRRSSKDISQAAGSVDQQTAFHLRMQRLAGPKPPQFGLITVPRWPGPPLDDRETAGFLDLRTKGRGKQPNPRARGATGARSPKEARTASGAITVRPPYILYQPDPNSVPLPEWLERLQAADPELAVRSLLRLCLEIVEGLQAAVDAGIPHNDLQLHTVRVIAQNTDSVRIEWGCPGDADSSFYSDTSHRLDLRCAALILGQLVRRRVAVPAFDLQSRLEHLPGEAPQVVHGEDARRDLMASRWFDWFKDSAPIVGLERIDAMIRLLFASSAAEAGLVVLHQLADELRDRLAGRAARLNQVEAAIESLRAADAQEEAQRIAEDRRLARSLSDFDAKWKERDEELVHQVEVRLDELAVALRREHDERVAGDADNAVRIGEAKQLAAEAIAGHEVLASALRAETAEREAGDQRLADRIDALRVVPAPPDPSPPVEDKPPVPRPPAPEDAAWSPWSALAGFAALAGVVFTVVATFGW